jgi:class 3 adenylate cyclase/pimeloyl-ACP methyl ester carboxylesterase
MVKERVERRLAAIFAADVAGFSRLTEADEEGTVAALKAFRHGLIEPKVAEHSGRIVKTAGDGLLVEFPSVVDAVRCAIETQRGMAARNSGRPPKERIQYRVGINLGDVLVDDGDILGDGVNVAARLEGLAKPGGLCVSDVVRQTVLDRVNEPFRDLGLQRVKNIARPIRVWQWTPDASPDEPEPVAAALNQTIRFCTAPDGVQIAYATVGEGPPLLKAPNWLNHLEYEWRNPAWGPAFAALARHHRLVRFDQRGNGLSDWEVAEISEDAMIADMAAVADAAGLDSFALLGISQGCAFSVRYAVENPQRVRCLVLLGGYVRGRLRRGSAEQAQLYEAAKTMIRQGWGSPNPTYRHFFTSTLMPDATPEQAANFDELQRISVAPANAERIFEMNAHVDVSDLARRVKVPTLVLHCVGDRMCSLDDGRRMAALIPGARFVALEGNNHVPMEGTPAFDAFIEEADAFLAEHGG